MKRGVSAASSSNNKEARQARHSKQKKVATLIGFFAALGGVAFFMFGLPHVLPPAWMQAHNQQLAAHYHVTIKGVEVPSNIGIDPSLWNDHSLDQFGIQGFAPVHTHDTSGTVHIETTQERSYTLGYFFSLWGVKPSSVCLDMAGAYCQPLTGLDKVTLADGETFKVTLPS